MTKTETISGGEVVYRVLRANQIDTVFGLLGGSMLELYDAIYRGDDIRYIGARDERAAGHMADAYARIRGAPGVVLGAQAGPGVVNLTTAVAQAHLAYSPLVVIAGAVSRGDHGKDTFQEVDQVALFAPICKRSIMVDRRGATRRDVGRRNSLGDERTTRTGGAAYPARFIRGTVTGYRVCAGNRREARRVTRRGSGCDLRCIIAREVAGHHRRRRLETR